MPSLVTSPSEGQGWSSLLSPAPLFYRCGDGGSERDEDPTESSDSQPAALRSVPSHHGRRAAQTAAVLAGAVSGFSWRPGIGTPSLDFTPFLP